MTRIKAKQKAVKLLVRQIIHCPLRDLWEVSKRPSSFKACSQKAPVKLLNRCCDATDCSPVRLAPKCCLSHWTVKVQRQSTSCIYRVRWQTMVTTHVVRYTTASSPPQQHDSYDSQDPDDSFGILTVLRAARSVVLFPAGPRGFSLLLALWPGLGLTHSATQLITVAFSLRVRRTGPEADHYPPANDEVKNEWSYSSTPKCIHGGVHINSFTVIQGVHINSFSLPVRFSRIICKCILITWKGVDWIKLAQGRDQWWILVNIVINYLVP
jgi:hypothetical protein